MLGDSAFHRERIARMVIDGAAGKEAKESERELAAKR
jgi:hypothetical protein